MIRECTRCRSGARVSASNEELSFAANEQVQYQSPFGGGNVTYATNEQATAQAPAPAPDTSLSEAAAAFAAQFGGATQTQTQSPIATKSAQTSDPFAGTFGGQSVSQYEASRAAEGGYTQRPSSYDPYQTQSGCGSSCKRQKLACDDRNGCNRNKCSCKCSCRRK